MPKSFFTPWLPYVQRLNAYDLVPGIFVCKDGVDALWDVPKGTQAIQLRFRTKPGKDRPYLVRVYDGSDSLQSMNYITFPEYPSDNPVGIDTSLRRAFTRFLGAKKGELWVSLYYRPEEAQAV